MPGYNVEGPGAAFSNTLEDYYTKRAREAQIQQELNQRMQIEQLRAQQQQQSVALGQAQLAQRIKEGDMEDFFKKTSMLHQNDIPGADYVQQAQRLGMGHLVPQPAPLPETMPGVAAIPLGPNGSPETQQPAGVNPPQPVRFLGTPQQRDVEQQRQERRQFIGSLPAGPLRLGAQAHEYLGFNPSAAELGVGGSQGSDFNRRITRVNEERAAQGMPPLTSDQELDEMKKVASARRPGGAQSWTDDDVTMTAWNQLATGKDPNMRQVGGEGNLDAVKHKMSELKAQYNLPPLAEGAAAYKAWSTALTDQTKRASALQATADGADKTFDNVLAANPGVSRTDSQWINEQMLRVYKGLAPAPEVTDLEAKIYAAIREYQKVVSGSAASIAEPSAHAIELAGQLLRSSQSPETLQAAVEAMRSDMNAYVSGQTRQVDTLRGIIGRSAAPPGEYHEQPGQSLQRDRQPTGAPAGGPGPEFRTDPNTGQIYRNGKPWP